MLAMRRFASKRLLPEEGEKGLSKPRYASKVTVTRLDMFWGVIASKDPVTQLIFGNEGT